MREISGVTKAEEIVTRDTDGMCRRVRRRYIGGRRPFGASLNVSLLKTAGLWRFANAFTGRQAVRYGERQRPEHRSKGILIIAQVADAPRTVPKITPLSCTCNRNPL